jgi:hypothetical protein
MMHPDEAALLRWLDEGPDATAEALAMHLTGCPICQERLAALAAEGHLLRSALALTPEETAFLRAARLPDRLALAAAGGPVQPWHLFGLLGMALMVALAWAGLVVLTGDALDRLWRLLNVPDLLLRLALSAGSALLALGGALVSQGPLLLLLATAGVAGVLIWARRATPAAGLSTA